MTKTPPNSVHPKTRAEWRMWLSKNYMQAEGIWLITFKKASGKPRIEYDDAVEEALCFGWVDSKPNKLDDERAMLWFAPRKAGTGWSKLNKSRAEKLIASGLMTPAGLSRIEAAKQDGSWNALDSIEALEIPPDLEKALADDKVAQEYSCMIPFITDEINKVISEMHYASTIIAYAPSNSLNIEINGAERIFKKSRDTKSSNGNTSDNELWESISCDFGRNPEITELILIDDCVSSGRTANIAKNKFEEKNGQSVNASVIAVLFDPPPAPLDMTKFEPT